MHICQKIKTLFESFIHGMKSIGEGMGYISGCSSDILEEIKRDHRPGWEKDTEAIQKDWEAVGDDMKRMGL